MHGVPVVLDGPNTEVSKGIFVALLHFIPLDVFVFSISSPSLDEISSVDFPCNVIMKGDQMTFYFDI